MVKEDAVKQTIFQKIFDKNPLLEFKDHERWEQHLVNPADSNFKNWTKSNSFSTGIMDPANNIRDQIKTDLWQWDTNPSSIISGFTSELMNPIGDRSFNVCMELEMSALGCVEYYGCKRGQTICARHYDDFYECIAKHKQFLRSMAMLAKRRVRWREAMAGKRDWESVYIPIGPDGVWKDPFPSPKDKCHIEWR